MQPQAPFKQLRQRLFSTAAPPSLILNEHKKWQHIHHFPLMLGVSSTILDDITEFPMRCYQSGGLVFFIIYVVMYIVFGIPMVILECQFGQYFGQSNINILRHMCPLAQGIGILQLITMFSFLVKTHVKMVLLINYIFTAMVFKAPWVTCGNFWSQINCYTKRQYLECLATNKYFWNNTCNEPKLFCQAFNRSYSYHNDTFCIFNEGYEFIPNMIINNHTTPGKDYFDWAVGTKLNGDVFDLYFLVNFCLVWLITITFVHNGFNKTGLQTAHITFIISNIIIIFLFFATLMFYGGFTGIRHGLVLKIETITNYQTWLTAICEVLKTLCIGLGTNTMIASHNRFNEKFIPSVFTSGFYILILNQLIYSLLIYALWGVISVQSNRTFDDIADTNFHLFKGRLAIISMIPDLFLHHPAPQVWIVLFIISVICKEIGIHIIILETITTSLSDVSSFCRSRPRTIRSLLALTGFFTGILILFAKPLKTITELLVVLWFDYEFVAFIEVLIFGLVYGFVSGESYRQFANLKIMSADIHDNMILYLRIGYFYIAPLFAIIYIVLKLYLIQPDPANDYIKIAMILYAIKTPIIILAYALYVIQQAISKREKIITVIEPTKYWYPQNYGHRTEYTPPYLPYTFKYKFALLANKMGYEL